MCMIIARGAFTLMDANIRIFTNIKKSVDVLELAVEAKVCTC